MPLFDNFLNFLSMNCFLKTVTKRICLAFHSQKAIVFLKTSKTIVKHFLLCFASVVYYKDLTLFLSPRAEKGIAGIFE